MALRHRLYDLLYILFFILRQEENNGNVYEIFCNVLTCTAKRNMDEYYGGAPYGRLTTRGIFSHTLHSLVI